MGSSGRTTDVSLSDALEKVASKTVSVKNEGLSDLRHVLKHNQGTPKISNLKESALLKIFNALFDAASSDRSDYLKKRGTIKTKPTSEGRLFKCASTLRVAVEVGLRNIKLKSVKAIIEHITHFVIEPNGDFCPPLVLDYSKCLSALLSHGPHVEHLSQELWNDVTRFCLERIQSVIKTDDGLGSSILSVQSSRSHILASQTSANNAALPSQAVDAFLNALGSLTSVSYAPLVDQGSQLLSTMARFLDSSSSVGKPQIDALVIINNTLLQVRPENIRLTKKFTRQAISLAKTLWHSKLLAAKDEVLVMLVMLHPYVEHISQESEDRHFLAELENLVEAIKSEYVRRPIKDQLQLNQLSLRFCKTQSSSGLQCQILSLRDGLAMGGNILSPEHNWTLIRLLALFSVQGQSSKAKKARRSESPGAEPQKRQRTATWSDDFMRMLSDPSTSAKICSLQLICFAAQTIAIDQDILEQLVEKLAAYVNDDISTIASWAQVALASCASQVCAQADSLTQYWSSIWRLTVRAVNPSPTCRTACHLLHTMLHARLVDRTVVLETLNNMLSSISVNGPTVFCDSVAAFLKTVVSQLELENASLSEERAKQVLNWLFRSWAPSNFYDKLFASQNPNSDIIDILDLTNVCLGLPAEREPLQVLPIWGTVARAWILHEQTRELVDYLLLRSKRDQAHIHFIVSDNSSGFGPSLNSAARSLVLGLCTTETNAAIEKWENVKEQGAGNFDMHMIRLVSNLVLAGLCLANCLGGKDMHRAGQLRTANKKLSDLLFQDLSNPSSEQNKVDALLQIVAHHMILEGSGLPEDGGQRHHKCMSLLSPRLLRLLERRQEMSQSDILADNNDVSDIMDIDTDFESQVTSHTIQTKQASSPRKFIEYSYGTAAQRAGVTVYAKLMRLSGIADEDQDEGAHQPDAFIKDILELPIPDILASGPVLAALPLYGAEISAKQFEVLLGYFADKTLPSYEYERAETNTALILDLMMGFVQTWTDSSDQDLYTFGLDIYRWFAVTALEAGMLSALVQKRLAQLMMQVLHIDAEYGQSDGLKPIRAILFHILHNGSLEIKYFIANHVSSIFDLFSLPVHEEILEELRISLSSDQEWVEGMAIRVLVFANIASGWHSLRKRCIYHVFETAGSAVNSRRHAAACVSKISHALKLQSAQEIFRLFASQLLYSWLTEHALEDVPFSIFAYESMNALLEHNIDEIYPQLILREREEDIRWVLQSLNSTEDKILRSSFSRAVAYAVSWDTCVKEGADSSQSSNSCESRLRSLFRTSGEYYSLIQSNFPDVVAHLFNTAYQEDTIDKALEKRTQYGYAKDALNMMKKYGSLDREIDQVQQPHFKGRYLIDQLERICRRTGHKSLRSVNEVFDVPHATVTLRSIINCIHPAYGPLYTCQTVRKVRIFVALIGDVVFDGYPLQLLVRWLQPIIVDPHCSDDAMGILQYLLEKGRHFLSQEISMLTGTSLLILLSLKQFMTSRKDKTTQESQFRTTVFKMQAFHDWLVNYLLQFESVFGREQQKRAFSSLVHACRDLELPISGEVDETASTMLKGLLDDEETNNPVLDPLERRQILSTLCRQFQTSDASAQDIFGSDASSLMYARRVWLSTQTLSVADGYRIWAARILGRAYSSTVSLEAIQPTQGLISHLRGDTEEQDQSKRAIVTRLKDLLSSDNRMHVGVAEQSLRKISNRFLALGDHNGSIEFEQLLPSHIVSANSRAYGKDEETSTDSQKFRREDLWHAAKLNTNVPFESWVRTLAMAICRWVKDNPIVGQLTELFSTVDQCPQELFPFIVHLALSSEIEKEQVFRTYMSESFNSHLLNHEADTDRKSRLLLETLLYLLTQPVPQERTRMDRVGWIEIDYLVAAEAADKCNMPTAALYLGEIGIVPESGPRPSRRSSTDPSSAKMPSNELLLSIYSRVDDPDSFYGVRQSPSLESVLARVHHEGDGLKGMMLHSARMDASLRRSGHTNDSDSFGMIGSMGAMNLSSLTHDLLQRRRGNQSIHSTTDTMLEAARKLEQWDISPPQKNDTAISTLYGVFRGISIASNLDVVHVQLNEALKLSIERLQDPRLDASTARATLSSIAILNEVDELTTVRCAADLRKFWSQMQARQKNWDIGRFNDAQGIVSYRETLFSLLSQNKHLREALHVSTKDCRIVEARAVISSSQFARKNGLIQQSLTAATYLSQLVPICQEIDVKMDAAAQFEVASTLWRQGETATSVQMLHDLCSRTDLMGQDIEIGRAGMLAQLGHEIAEARLEKPEEVIAHYLKPAIEQLDEATGGSEAGRVYHEFASYCDQQLQNPGNIEDFQRLAKLRERKAAELEQVENLIRAQPTKEAKKQYGQQFRTTKAWFDLDNDEYKKAVESRDQFVQQSLQNYLRALSVSDEFDASVVRFFALWLEHSDSNTANLVVQKYLPRVPSWKFVGLLNQETSRLQNDQSVFQRSLADLISRICIEHPYHGLQHIYSSCSASIFNNEQAATLRREAAVAIARALHKDKRVGDVTSRNFRASAAYHKLADVKTDPRKGNKFTLKNVEGAKEMNEAVQKYRVPPATMSIDLRPSANYSDVPIVSHYRDDIRLAGGLSAPKILVAVGTDGQQYKQLFKGGNDDLRQDAIMEQVFGEVSKMLQNHKSSRQRNLHVRTYKVLPLSSRTGIIEFVPNSMPLGEFLVPAHVKYHPGDLKHNQARERIAGAQGMGKESRWKIYREVAAKHQPVLRHFFFERFEDPDDWFQKRLNYTRSTATISILGHILGLGDRHCHNILLDEKSGEAIHIDLGVAFEAGRVLPVPEVVPFRLTRDIVDGMGVTKTEGSFRRCCEFVMSALRHEKDAIMTLLNVLRYDPLYSWTMSPVKARRMQDTTKNEDEGGNGLGSSSKRPEDEAGEAARALAIVEKKLSKTLSTEATVNELIQQATDERNLAVLFAGWAPFS